MSYPPLAEVRKDLRVEWYRCPIDGPKLRELSRRSDLQGWYQAGGHLALFLLTGALTYFFWLQQIWVGVVVGLFFHGTVGSFLRGVASHELVHGSVFRTKILNKFFLYLFSLLGWFDFFDYSGSHTYHHRYTLHPEGDREVLLPIKPTTGKTFLLQMFTINHLDAERDARSAEAAAFLPTIIATIRSAMAKAGSPDTFQVGVVERVEPGPAGSVSAINVVVTRAACVSWWGSHRFDCDRSMDLDLPADRLLVHRQLGLVRSSASRSTAG